MKNVFQPSIDNTLNFDMSSMLPSTLNYHHSPPTFMNFVWVVNPLLIGPPVIKD